MKSESSVILSKNETRKFTSTVLLDLIAAALKKRKRLIILLEGPLGAGKTQLVKWVGRTLGIRESITSPTFILWQIYKFNSKLSPEARFAREARRARSLLANLAYSGLAKGGKTQKSKLITNFYLHHIDLYRLKNPKDIFKLSLNQKLKEKNNLFLIEWGERIEKFIPKPFIKLRIDFAGKNTRKIVIINRR